MWEGPSRLNLAGGPPPSVMSRLHKNCGCWNTRTDTVRAKGIQGMRHENAVWDRERDTKIRLWKWTVCCWYTRYTIDYSLLLLLASARTREP